MRNPGCLDDFHRDTMTLASNRSSATSTQTGRTVLMWPGPYTSSSWPGKELQTDRDVLLRWTCKQWNEWSLTRVLEEPSRGTATVICQCVLLPSPLSSRTLNILRWLSVAFWAAAGQTSRSWPASTPCSHICFQGPGGAADKSRWCQDCLFWAVSRLPSALC